MLSLSPRYDLFRFSFPKDFLPKDLEEKYQKLFITDSAVISSPINYLNESIVGVTFPGISDINITQTQHGFNTTERKSGKINVEPKHEINHVSPENPLEKIDKEFKVTFRLNQGFYNYFMLYETIFYKICKPIDYPPQDILYIELLDATGNIISRVKFINCYIDGIEGLNFDYTKIEREAGTFEVTFKFDNIDYEIITVE